MFPFRKRDPHSATAPPIPSSIRFLGVVAALALALSMHAGWLLAARQATDPIVVTVPVVEVRTQPRAGGGFLPPATTGDTSTCRGVSPGPSWTCVNGTWTTGASQSGATSATSTSSTTSTSSAASSSSGSTGGGGGGGGGINGCLTAQPGPSFRCQAGVWTFGVPVGGSTGATSPGLESPRTAEAGGASSTSATTSPTAPASSGSAGAPGTTMPASGASCAGPRPVASLGESVVCVGGSWVVR